MASSLSYTTIKHRSDFVAATARGAKWITPSFIMLAMKMPERLQKDYPQAQFAVGYTVTKKVGRAHERNRIRRRLRAAMAECASLAPPGHAYVVIARKAALQCGFAELKRDVQFAFKRILSPKKIKDDAGQ